MSPTIMSDFGFHKVSLLGRQYDFSENQWDFSWFESHASFGKFQQASARLSDSEHLAERKQENPSWAFQKPEFKKYLKREIN